MRLVVDYRGLNAITIKDSYLHLDAVPGLPTKRDPEALIEWHQR